MEALESMDKGIGLGGIVAGELGASIAMAIKGEVRRLQMGVRLQMGEKVIRLGIND